MAYSEDLRMPTVKHYLESGDTFEQTAKIFGVGKTTVRSWVQQYKETGTVAGKALHRGHKKIAPEELRTYVKEHPDDTQEEMAVVFGCTNQAISKALKRLKITRKKKRAAIRSRSRKK